MTNENGILGYGENDIILIPHDASKKFENSIYGFKLRASESNLVWVHATEQDYKESESIRKNIPKEEVAPKPNIACQNSGPMTCATTFCDGYAKFCRLYYNPKERYYYCACSPT